MSIQISQWLAMEQTDTELADQFEEHVASSPASFGATPQPLAATVPARPPRHKGADS